MLAQRCRYSNTFSGGFRTVFDDEAWNCRRSCGSHYLCGLVPISGIETELVDIRGSNPECSNVDMDRLRYRLSSLCLTVQDSKNQGEQDAPSNGG